MLLSARSGALLAQRAGTVFNDAATGVPLYVERADWAVSAIRPRTGAEHDVVVEECVLHGHDHEVVSEMHAHSGQGAAAEQDVAIGSVEDVETLARHARDPTHERANRLGRLFAAGAV